MTQLLVAWSQGEERARDELIPLVYTEQRRFAARQFARERSGRLWQPTALVHEAYERLVDLKSMCWQNRAHFYALAARVMRSVLVDHAREQRRQKRGAGRTLLSLDEAAAPERSGVDLLAIDDALTRLVEVDRRQRR